MRGDAMRKALIASVIVAMIGITAFIVVNNQVRVETSSASKQWKVCNATLLDPIERKPLKNFTVYWAWNDDLMHEGYKFKSTYDFLNQSAIGMLFLFNNVKYPITITMKDVNMSLLAVFYTIYVKPSEPVEELSNASNTILLEYYTDKELEPGKEYSINYGFIKAMIEFNPQAYSELHRVCKTTPLFNLTYCYYLDNYYIQLNLDECKVISDGIR